MKVYVMTTLSHALIYLGLSTRYAGTLFGLDKSWVGGFTAALYMLLAIDEWLKHHK